MTSDGGPTGAAGSPATPRGGPPDAAAGAGVRSGVEAGPQAGTPSGVPAQAARPGGAPAAAVGPDGGSAAGARPPGVLRQILGHDDEDDDRPLPDLPPLPADHGWRIEHLPLITAIGLALSLCAGSVGFLAAGPTAGLGVAAGVFVVAIGFSLSTLAIAWADVIRPALVLPVGLAVYVIKFALIALILLGAGASGWDGARPMAYGIAIGAVGMTAVQAWWMSRVANRRLRSLR